MIRKSLWMPEAKNDHGDFYEESEASFFGDHLSGGSSMVKPYLTSKQNAQTAELSCPMLWKPMKLPCVNIATCTNLYL